MTQKTETSWQKPPLRERFFDPILGLFWVLMVPFHIVISFFIGCILLPEIIEFSPILLFIAAGFFGVIGWKVTFWWVCQKAPKLYPICFLIHTHSTKRTWNKPPSYFYTEEFQRVFKNFWIPYLSRNPHTSFETKGTSSSNQFDLSPHPTFSCNPSSATNMAFNNIHQINNEPFQSCIGEYN